MILSTAGRTIMLILLFALAACNAPSPVEPTAVSTMLPTTVPTTASTPELRTPETASAPATSPVAATPQLSFTPATYTDAQAGFVLDYPATWTLAPNSQVGVHGGQALLLSPGATLETLANSSTRVSITTYIWDPKNDLDAYVAQRKVAWDASGFGITREEQWQLADGRRAYVFTVQTPEQPTFMLLTTIGQDYLQIGGEGDLALVEEIGHTLRSLN